MSLMLGEHGGKAKPPNELQVSNQQLSGLYHWFEPHNLNVSTPFLCENSRISVFPQEADLRAQVVHLMERKKKQQQKKDFIWPDSLCFPFPLCLGAN